ncbi:UvrD-helicase domain-containing protein [Maribacter thermophilus]|uniref:UvrD-helicase domain-containing protein n=1 Tax=Maribacter thermophilus TaxID=1197874 RepID=UPI000640BB86|nr:UvrD-helicase domain-containing protein [Maribacter thermophilus]
MRESSFKIYNASAGSGKTYALSKAYLKIVLSSSNSFRRILAITFTNKAVNEMKSRILQNLFQFSQVTSLEKAPPLFKEIMSDLNLTDSTLRNLSKIRLKEILHNYAFFDVSTIDKFTHRVIRTFARDLKIPQNFEVVLDVDLLLDEAVSRVIARAGEDIELTKVLMDFALEKIDDDRSWDITYDLTNIGKLLFDENNAKHIHAFSDKTISDFQKLQKKVLSKIKETEKKATTTAEETLSYISSTGLDDTDFPRQTLPNHFKKIRDGQFLPSQLYNNNLEENLKAQKIVKANVSPPSEDIAVNLLHYYQNTKKLIYTRSFFQNIYRNLVPLTLLNEIENEIKKIQQEKDQLSISEFNAIISKEIKNQPAPFIYERLGEKYRHYFIDEFQDTSEMQWSNLLPLIGNALEGEDEQGNTGSLFLVGDAKQAIYRWRGGKAEQFLNLVTQSSQPFSITADTHILPRNYRSFDEIVRFNNSFFQSVSPFLENPVYRAFFEEGNKQETNQKEGGYVKLAFLEEEDDEHYALKTLEAITESLQNGFKYEDICIIIRKKKHAAIIADYLMKNQVPVISSESLLLSASPKVQFLISLSLHALFPMEAEYSYQILRFLSDNTETEHDFINKNLGNVDSFLEEGYNFNLKKFMRNSVLDAMEYAIKAFELGIDSDAHLLSFMDLVFEVEQQKGADIQSFLNYWEKKGDSLSISTPDNVSAVQIMTIHKAKGLEFPVVIFPYANSNIFEEIDPKLWMPVDRETFLGFKELLISKKKEVAEYGTTEASLFSEEHNKLQLDAFNLLYVALTRAVQSLYIISFKHLSKDGNYKTDYYSGLFIHFLSGLGLWNPNKLEYEFGAVPVNSSQSTKQTSTVDIPYIYTHKDNADFRIHTKAGMLWDTEREEAIKQGNIIHYILSDIKQEHDLTPAMDKAVQNGILSSTEYNIVQQKLLKLVRHPNLKEYFSAGYNVLNEKDILMQDGTILRPDRVNIKDNLVSIIDYKTGQKNNKYYEQLDSYANAFMDMGYEIRDKIIVYINQNITVESI